MKLRKIPSMLLSGIFQRSKAPATTPGSDRPRINRKERIRLMKQDAIDAASDGDILRMLENMLAFQRFSVPCPRLVARAFNKLLRSEEGCAELSRHSAELLLRHPENIFLTFVRATTLAKANYTTDAFELVNETILSKISQDKTQIRDRENYIRDIQYLVNIWNIIDYTSRNMMRDSIVDSRIKQLSVSYNLSDRHFIDADFLKDKKFILSSIYLGSRDRERYIDECEFIFKNSDDLNKKIKSIQFMVKKSRRSEGALHKPYEKANKLYNEMIPSVFSLIEEREKFSKYFGKRFEKNILTILSSAVSVAHQLDYNDDKKKIIAHMVDIARESCSESLWLTISALMKFGSREHNPAIEELAVIALQVPVPQSHLSSFFRYALDARKYALASEIYKDLPPKLKNSTKSVFYADICKRQGKFEEAGRVVDGVVHQLLARPNRIGNVSSWRIVTEIQDELKFLEETWDYFRRFKQPSKPDGIVFVPCANANHIRLWPLTVLMELRKMNWAVIPICEGTLPPDRTGIEEVDNFIWHVPPGKWSQYLNETLSPGALDQLAPELKKGKLVWDGIDLSHALWETASIIQRKYSVDFTCPHTHKVLLGLAEQAICHLEIMKKIKGGLSRDYKISFIAPDIHVLPNAVFREYCEKHGDASRFCCINVSNSYQNYEKNFKQDISTRISVANITANPEIRVAFLPKPTDFEAWYRSGRARSSASAGEIEKFVGIKRATGGGDRNPSHAAQLAQIRQRRDEGARVACLFGKVVCDTAVPRDGGPAHKDMKDWLNHTIDLTRGTDTLLLVKPHPHELKNEIGLFLNEFFSDLIEADLHEGVVFLDHNSFDMQDLKGQIDFGLLWNGTAAVELGTMGIPAILCSYNAPTDYPVGQVAPKSRAHYERLVTGNDSIDVATDLQARSAAWLSYLQDDGVSVPYRYYARQMTNKRVHPTWWFKHDIDQFLAEGDRYVERLADRITGEPGTA